MDDTRETSTSGHSSPGRSRGAGRPKPPTAKWGAACSACATAKAKCIRTNTDPASKCDRCDRLFKECTAQVHKPRKKRQVKPSRTAQMEERLNGLINMLKAEAEGDSHRTEADAQKLGNALEAKVALSASRSESPSSITQDNPWAIPEAYNSAAPSSCMCRPDDAADIPPPQDSDETLLDIYRSQLLPVHPFVVIPPTMSAASLNEERPFLMSAIRMVASFRSLRSMRAQMYHIMQEISDRMLIQSERSMDLLLGLIVIIGWYQYHCFLHAQLNNLISLAKALIGDMKLQMPPNRNCGSVLSTLKPFDVPPRTNEERRAYAGVWFLSSSLSLGFGRTESMKYTRYLHQCLKELEASFEYETDIDLVYLVRIQYLIDRISQCGTMADSRIDDMPSLPFAPVPKEIYVSALEMELDQLRQNLPQRLKMNQIFQVWLDSAALRLHSPPHVDSDEIISLSERLSSLSFNSSPSPLNSIYKSHATLVTWFDTWLAVPTPSYYRQTTATCSLLIYAISMLGRWAKLIAPTRRAAAPSLPRELACDPSYTSAASSSVDRISLPSTASSIPTPAASDKDENREPCGYGNHNPQTKADPNLPTAVASLQAILKQQPGLSIDIPTILTTLQSRMQQVSTSLQESAALEIEKTDQNAWGMSACKVFLTRMKLERWADLVAMGTESLRVDGCTSQLTSMGNTGDNPLQDGLLDGLGSMHGSMPDFGVGMASIWTSDLMTWTGPDEFNDGMYFDWNSMVVNMESTN